jgi:hypothetical protein
VISVIKRRNNSFGLLISQFGAYVPLRLLHINKALNANSWKYYALTQLMLRNPRITIIIPYLAHIVTVEREKGYV